MAADSGSVGLADYHRAIKYIIGRALSGDGGSFRRRGKLREERGSFGRAGGVRNEEDAFRRAGGRLKAGTRPSPGPEGAAPQHPRGTDRGGSTSAAGPGSGGDRIGRSPAGGGVRAPRGGAPRNSGPPPPPRGSLRPSITATHSPGGVLHSLGSLTIFHLSLRAGPDG